MTAKKDNKNNINSVEASADLEQTFVHLARLALQGRSNDVAALVRNSLRRIETRRADLQPMITEALNLVDHTPLRRQITPPSPVDPESRLELLRVERVVVLDREPRWTPNILGALERVVAERQRLAELRAADVAPTRSILFVGAPGVGKTLAARWVAKQLGLPLLVLDLASVMNSFLGKTGVNLRSVMERARAEPSVLLLDEFDALAKRRDDAGDVGELKRLVTVLIQELDAWPDSGLLIAATNHPELLDPAIWRRFDTVVEFPKPTAAEVSELLQARLQTARRDAVAVAARMLGDASYADVDRLVARTRRNAVIDNVSLDRSLLEAVANDARNAPADRRADLGIQLMAAGHSQRQASELTGVARETLRKRTDGAGKKKKGKAHAS